jgi:hypothetical protein
MRTSGRLSLGARTIGAIVALSVGLASTVALPTASAQGKPPAKTPTTKKKEDKKPAATAEAPTVATPVTIAPKDLAWGIDKKKLATIYDKVIDEDYKPKYQKTQPGPALDRLDAEVAERKAEFRRSEIQFGNVATGMDQTNLKGEFTYGNKEHLLSIDRGGKTRYFFFIGDKMWKVVDAIKLGEKSQWGKTFDDAVAILNKHYGVAGRARPADDAAGRPFAEVDWKDTKFQVRAVNWDDGTFGLVFQDPVTVANLPTLRKAATATAKEIDAKVKDAAAKKPEQAPPPKKK